MGVWVCVGTALAFLQPGEASPVQLLKCTSLPVKGLGVLQGSWECVHCPPGTESPVLHNGRMGWSRKGRGLGNSLEFTPGAAPAITPQVLLLQTPSEHVPPQHSSLPTYGSISHCPMLGSISREGEDQPEQLEHLSWGGLDCC